MWIQRCSEMGQTWMCIAVSELYRPNPVLPKPGILASVAISWPYFRSVDSTTNADLPYGTQKSMWLYCPKGMTILENQPDGGLQFFEF